MMNFSIKDLAAFSGLKQHTIRIWEQRYNFLQPQRTKTSQRIYTVEELNVLLDVVLLNQEGYRVSHIDRMSLDEKLKVFSELANKQQKAVHELIIHMARMDADGFEMALDSSINFWGMQVTMQQILFPFCNMTGLLQNELSKNYSENIILVGQIIKQKLFAAIEKSAPIIDSQKKALLFQFSEEAPETALLYLQYFLKINGFYVLHLGHQVSLDQLELICRHTEPDYLITQIDNKSSKKNNSLSSFIKNPTEALSQITMITIGESGSSSLNGSQHHRHTSDIMEALEMMLTIESVEA